MEGSGKHIKENKQSVTCVNQIKKALNGLNVIEIYRVTGCYVSNRKTLGYVKSFKSDYKTVILCVNVILAVVFATVKKLSTLRKISLV